MRSVDLALYADALAARAALLAAELERARARLRQTAIERQARTVLDEGDVRRLERLGVLCRTGVAGQRAEIAHLAASIASLERLQAWVEAELFAAREEGFAMSE